MFFVMVKEIMCVLGVVLILYSVVSLVFYGMIVLIDWMCVYW